jgi:hypothetical protein
VEQFAGHLCLPHPTLQQTLLKGTDSH